MARVKISELPELNIATLDTTYVAGVYDNTTYRIPINRLTSSLDTTFATDLVVNAISGTINTLATTASLNSLSTSIDNRLDGLETFSSSADNRYILSGSLTQTTWENISGKPNNIVSSSTQISELGFISTSTDLSFLNLFTASQYISNSYFATTGSNTFEGEQIISGAFTVSISGNAFGVNENPTPNNIFWSYIPNDTNTTSIENGWIANIETVGVYTVTNVEYDYPFVKITLDDVLLELPYRCNGYFSLETKELKFESDGVLKITGSLNVSLGITGSTDFNTIVNKPTLISSSTQISDLGFVTGAYAFLTEFNSLTQSFNIISGSVVNIESGFDTASYQLFTQSIESRVSGLEASTSSYLTSLNGAISSSTQVLNGSGIYSSSAQLPTNIISSSTQISSLGFISTSVSLTDLNTISASYLTFTQSYYNDSASFSTRIINAQPIGYLTTSSYNADSASFDSRINSIVTESGSNLTYLLEAYANVTYTLPGTFTEDICRYSVVSATENVPSNWFNTSSYTFTPQKAGYWEIIASYDVYRNAEASLIIKKNNNIVASAGSFNAVAQDISKIVYLNGSTDYINIYNVGGAALQRDQYQSRSWFQAKFVGNIDGSTDLLTANNTFTGNNTFNGTTRFETVGGDEGGEIEFGVPQTNTTLSTRVVQDIFQNRLRIFDGNTNGVFIDLSKAPTGVSGELMHKASGFVNRGVDVTLGNLKARMAATGNASLQLSTVSGTYSVYGSGVYSQAGGVAGSNLSSTISITTTPTYIVASYNFGVAGAVDTWNIVDVNLGIAWRITMIVGFGYNNNFISIERLH